MTELDILRHAKDWLDKLAEGLDPLTGALVPADDVVRKERIAKCLTYVSGVLDQLISRGGPETLPPVKKTRLPPFAVAPEALARFRPSSEPLTMTEFTRRINELAAPNTVDPLKAASILELLEAQGYLELITAPGKRGTRRPTAAGLQLGISLEDRQGQDGSYTVVVYGEQAQAFVLSQMDEIIARNTEKYNKVVDTGSLQGAPWTREQEAQLRELHQRGASLAEIARTMQRSTSGIQARLKRLGLENSN